MSVYYNEHDPKVAAWLRELIREGRIAHGDVDERSIEDVLPDELAGYAQCHFFAGIGGWSLALRLAGWPDDKPCWTGSAPCQPFSAAGKGAGFADERHLWPAFHWLIRQCRPERVFGEQVAANLAWLDLVSADLEVEGYAVGSVIVGAHSVGAPHIRQRLYWVADAERGAAERHGFEVGGAAGGMQGTAWQRQRLRPDAGDGVATGDLGRPDHPGSQGRVERRDGADQRTAGAAGVAGVVADTGSSAGQWNAGSILGAEAEGDRERLVDGSLPLGHQHGGPTSFWSDAEWLWCRDGKWRPVEPGTFPLAHGVPARVGRLRGYGNAIVPPLAAEFINAAA